MADDAPRFIECFVEGESALFSIEATRHMAITDLRYLIKKNREHGAVSSVDAVNLILWKVR